MVYMELLIASIVKLLWFTLGYQTCKLVRKYKDQEFMNELYSSILLKIGETDLIKNSNENKNDIIKEEKEEV